MTDEETSSFNVGSGKKDQVPLDAIMKTCTEVAFGHPLPEIKKFNLI
jgi:hypothetical protein